MRNEKRKLSTITNDVDLPTSGEIQSLTSGSVIASGNKILSGTRIVNATGVNGRTTYGIFLPIANTSTLPIIVRNVSAYEFALRSSDAANVYINGAKGATHALAIATAKMAICIPVSTTEWIVEVVDYTAAAANE